MDIVELWKYHNIAVKFVRGLNLVVCTTTKLKSGSIYTCLYM